MKKILVLFLLVLICTSVFAEGFGIHGGFSAYWSHIGASYDLDEFELSVNLYDGFPTLMICTYDSSQSFFKNAWYTISMAFGFSVGGSYDVLESKKFDLDFGMNVAGFLSPILVEDEGNPLFLTLVGPSVKFAYNFNEKHGIYIGTEFPLLAMSPGPDGMDFSTVFSPKYDIEEGLTFMAILAKVGYSYRF